MTLNEDYDETLTLLSQAQNLYYQLFGDVHIKIAHTDFLQGNSTHQPIVLGPYRLNGYTS
jgi:hypothetical protein